MPTLEREFAKTTRVNFTLFLCVKNTPLNYARDGMQISIDQVELIFFRFGCPLSVYHSDAIVHFTQIGWNWSCRNASTMKWPTGGSHLNI